MIYRYGRYECEFTIEKKGDRAPLMQQVHGSQIVDIRETMPPPPADAAISFNAAISPYVFTADCLPILFYSPDERAPLAAAHCGWRGALDGIAEKTLRRCTEFGKNWHAVFGPAIMVCCFEVKGDFVQAFAKRGYDIAFYLERRKDRNYFDLPRWVRETQLGSLADAVHSEPLRCTVCSNPPLPSYRRNGAADPRICSLIRKSPLA